MSNTRRPNASNFGVGVGVSAQLCSQQNTQPSIRESATNEITCGPCPATVGVIVAVAVRVGVALRVAVRVTVIVGVPVRVDVPVRVGVPVTDGV